MAVARKHSYRYSRLAMGIAIAAAAIFSHLVLPAQSSALATETIRSLHGPGFGAIAIAFLWLFRGAVAIPAAYAKAGVSAVVVAVLAEIAQIPGERAAELRDVGTDILGIAAFLGCAAVLDRRFRRAVASSIPGVLAIIAIPLLIIVLAPSTWLAYSLYMRSQAVPTLLSFDHAWEQTFASGDEQPFDVIEAPAGWPAGSGKIARLHTAGEFGLMLHLRPYPDWRGYEAFSFIASTTDGAERRIALGFWGISPGNGQPASRHYRTQLIFPEPRRYCIALEKLHGENGAVPFDLEHVSEVLFGSARNAAGEQLLVDDFRLERSLADCEAENQS